MATIERPGRITKTRLTTVEGGQRRSRRDQLATEEPLEIRVEGPGMPQARVAVTMRTPGDDFDLACGFLLTEGLIGGRGDVDGVRYCAVPKEEQHYNVVSVTLTRPFDPELLSRNFFTTSSCGVCGKASIDAIRVPAEPVADGPTVPASVIVSLPDRLREAQRVFESTGGLHASGLFAADGTLVDVREDVGRHNALDKVIGHALLAGQVPLRNHVLAVSGRISFELVQKAAVAGIPVVCAVSAPSSLAVAAGREFGMTLVGFLRGDRFNVYSRPERIEDDDAGR